jgi:transketolase
MPVPLEMVALDDTFGRSGDGRVLMRRYGLSSEHIYDRAVRVIERKSK